MRYRCVKSLVERSGGDLLGSLMPVCHFALRMLADRSPEYIQQTVAAHTVEQHWSSWHQRFMREVAERNFFEAKHLSYQDAVTAEFLSLESPRRATRYASLEALVTLGFQLEAEEMWSLMERKFGFTSNDIYRTEVKIFDDSRKQRKRCTQRCTQWAIE